MFTAKSENGAARIAHNDSFKRNTWDDTFESFIVRTQKFNSGWEESEVLTDPPTYTVDFQPKVLYNCPLSHLYIALLFAFPHYDTDKNLVTR